MIIGKFEARVHKSFAYTIFYNSYLSGSAINF